MSAKKLVAHKLSDLEYFLECYCTQGALLHVVTDFQDNISTSVVDIDIPNV